MLQNTARIIYSFLKQIEQDINSINANNSDCNIWNLLIIVTVSLVTVRILILYFQFMVAKKEKNFKKF